MDERGERNVLGCQLQPIDAEYVAKCIPCLLTHINYFWTMNSTLTAGENRVGNYESLGIEKEQMKL